MLGDGALVDALRARAADSCRSQCVARVLVGPGTDRLDERQPGGQRNELVPPQPGDDEHIRFANSRAQIVDGGHLEVIDAGRAQREAVGEPVGRMSEGDPKIGRRKCSGLR